MKVTVKDCRDEGRNLPWLVTYYVDRKPVRKYFKTETEAEEHAAEVRKVLKSGADPATYALALRAAAGTGYSLLELVESGLAYKQATKSAGASITATFADAAQTYMDRQVEEKDAPCTLSSTKSVMKKIKERFGSKIASQILEVDVKMFLKDLPNRKGERGKASSETRKTYLQAFRGALRCIGIENPLPGIPEPVTEFKDIEFFTPTEAWAMLTKVSPNKRGTVALALFAGLRPHLLSRLPEACVDMKNRTIHIPRHLAKDRRPHDIDPEFRRSDGAILPGSPPVLWTWLEAYPYKRCSWKVLQRQLKKIIGRWVHDGTRHTAATFYNKFFKNAATSVLLTHEGQKMALEHYIGITTMEAAEAFYNLKPGDIAPDSYQERKPVLWPSNDELERWLREMPATKVAATLGCSDAALGKHCRTRNIPKPPRGYWAKVLHGTIAKAA